MSPQAVGTRQLHHYLLQQAEPLVAENRSPVQSQCTQSSWAGDITYIRTTEGWRYLAVWIDLFSRRVVGWKLGESMGSSLVTEALNRALGYAMLNQRSC